jgi:hypothetical protein
MTTSSNDCLRREKESLQRIKEPVAISITPPLVGRRVGQTPRPLSELGVCLPAMNLKTTLALVCALALIGALLFARYRECRARGFST